MVADYLAVGQKIDNGADERVILFIKLPPGQELVPEFEAKLKSEIRLRRSPRHVPARVRFLDFEDQNTLTQAMCTFYSFQ